MLQRLGRHPGRPQSPLAFYVQPIVNPWVFIDTKAKMLQERRRRGARAIMRIALI